MELFSADATMILKKSFFCPQKVEKNHHQNLRSTLFLTAWAAWAAQTAQAEEFVLQNVAYRPTVYRAGTYMNKKKIHVVT